MRWRIVVNKWNLKQAPWRDAVGIEEDDDRSIVPALLCWFTRPDGKENAERVVELHNRNLAK